MWVGGRARTKGLRWWMDDGFGSAGEVEDSVENRTEDIYFFGALVKTQWTNFFDANIDGWGFRE